MLLAAALLAALAAIVVAGAALRQASTPQRELETARGRLARIDAEMPTADQHPRDRAKRSGATCACRSRSARPEHDRAVLVQLLIDFRDVSGAEEAIFWRWIPERDSLAPAVWSSEADPPCFFSITEWAPLVQWSAEGGVVQTVGHEETVHVGAAPIRRGETLMGVLSLTHRTGLGWNRSALRDWLPRLADQLGTVQELVDVRRRYGRYMRQGQALLDAVQRLQGDKTGEGLARALCETALDVSGARGSRAGALVRGGRRPGSSTYATDGAGLRARAARRDEPRRGGVSGREAPGARRRARRALASALYGVAQDRRGAGLGRDRAAGEGRPHAGRPGARGGRASWR